MLAVTAFFSLLIASLIVVFAIRYRRRTRTRSASRIHGSLALELLWTVIPFVIAMVMFGWGAKVFFDIYRPPAGAMEIYVVGKQWMWKVQHMDGQREINELHVPVGRPVKLIMGSEDVIHSFFIPAFRVKEDVDPRALQRRCGSRRRKPGRYHLFCAEYCGTKHSGMIGTVVVMEPARSRPGSGGGNAADSPAAAGEKLFTGPGLHHLPPRRRAGARRRCSTACSAARCSSQGGATVVADEAYIRESIVNPQAKVVAGFQPIMPTFQGLVTRGAAAAAHRVRRVARRAAGPAAPARDRARRRASLPRSRHRAGRREPCRTSWKP